MLPIIPFLAFHVLAPPTVFLPASSPYRPLVVIIILINCALALRSIDPETWGREHFALYVCGFGLHSNYMINIRKVKAPPGKSKLQALRWALQCCFSPRTGIAVEDLPSFHVGDPQYVPSAAQFLIQRTWTLAWTMGGYVLFHRHPLVYYVEDFQSPKNQIVRRLGDINLREWMILLHTAFTGWFEPYCILTAVHSFSSVVAVACGDAPRNWRPLFGDIREAYTVQRFFGVFWHKLMRKAFTGNAAFLVHDIMGLSRGTEFSRQVIILVVLLISGSMHAVIPPLSLSCHGVWQVAYYCCVGATITLENVMRQFHRHYQISHGGKELMGRSAGTRAGYMWVIFFHLWTTAKFAYPPVICHYRSAVAHGVAPPSERQT